MLSSLLEFCPSPYVDFSFSVLEQNHEGGRGVDLSAMRRGTPERASVLRIVYKMDERDLNNYFLYQVFEGEAPFPPVILRTPADVRKFVGITPGAVGYLRASDVDESVKVVR